MAGHSKWANIKHRKAAQDKKRGKIWTKLIREVTVAAREGGGDPEANPRLRLAMDKAFGANMPRDTVDRAIKRGAGGDDGANYDEIRYEGYGPGGTAVMVDCADRQPQPHRGRSTPCVFKARRQPGDRRLGVLPVHQTGSDQLPARNGRGCRHGGRAGIRARRTWWSTTTAPWT